MAATTSSSEVSLAEFEAFVDWAIDAGADEDLDPITFGPWKRWAAGARTPNPAQVAAGTEFEYHSDTVYQKHAGKALTSAILQEAALAEYKQALQMQEEHKRAERERRAKDNAEVRRKEFESAQPTTGGPQGKQGQQGQQQHEDEGFQMGGGAKEM